MSFNFSLSIILRSVRVGTYSAGMGKSRLEEEGFASMSIETEREHKRGRRGITGLNLTALFEQWRPYSLQIVCGYFFLFFMVAYMYIPPEDLVELRTPDSLIKLSSRTVVESISGFAGLRQKIHTLSTTAQQKQVTFPNKIATSLLQDVSGVEVSDALSILTASCITCMFLVLFSLLW